MTEQDKFLARFEDMKARGLIDIKFFVTPGSEDTVDKFFADANRIHDAVADDRSRRHASWPPPKVRYEFGVDSL
ncbi:hypothetical protein [Azospirillum sp.]|uniref:hypothetical protein n=1 Tax=Azospirillum sp. TaxID=34012 RepID=UPI003D74154C